MKPPPLGEIIMLDGERWRVVEVWPLLTPYRAPGQLWTLGLRKVRLG